MKTSTSNKTKQERSEVGQYKLSQKNKKRVDKYYENYGKSDIDKI